MKSSHRAQNIAVSAWTCLFLVGFPAPVSAGPICHGFWDCLPLNATLISALATPFALLTTIIVGVALFRGFGRRGLWTFIVAWLMVVVSAFIFVLGARIRFGTAMANRRYAIAVNRNIDALTFSPKGIRCRAESSVDCRYEVGSSEIGPDDGRALGVSPSILLEIGHAGASDGRVKVWQVRAPDGPGPLCADVDWGSGRGIDWRIVTSTTCRLVSQTTAGVPIYGSTTSEPRTLGRQYTLVLENTLFVFDVFDPPSRDESGYVAQVDRVLRTLEPIPTAELRHEPPDSLLRVAIRTTLWW